MNIIEQYINLDKDKLAKRFWDATPGVFVNKMTGEMVVQFSYLKDSTEWWSTLCALILMERDEQHTRLIASPEVCFWLESTPFFQQSHQATPEFDDYTIREGILYSGHGSIILLKNPYWPRNLPLLVNDKMEMENGISFVLMKVIYPTFGFPMKG